MAGMSRAGGVMIYLDGLAQAVTLREPLRGGRAIVRADHNTSGGAHQRANDYAGHETASFVAEITVADDHFAARTNQVARAFSQGRGRSLPNEKDMEGY